MPSVFVNGIHTQDVFTEYGITDLRGKTSTDRTRALVGIAHPDFRESLKQDFRLSRR